MVGEASLFEPECIGSRWPEMQLRLTAKVPGKNNAALLLKNYWHFGKIEGTVKHSTITIHMLLYIPAFELIEGQEFKPGYSLLPWRGGCPFI